MANRRNRLPDRIILDLLEESDAEDYIPSDEDEDPSFTLDNNTTRNHSDSSSSSDSETNEVEERMPVVTPVRGRGRRRGNVSQVASRPATNGSTSSWIAKDFTVIEYMLAEPSYIPNMIEEFDKLQLFRQYVDDSLLDLMIRCTNQTAVARTGRSLNLNSRELNVYLGITMVMSAVNYPYIRMYWEKKWRVSLVADNMSRKRFFLIRNSLKVVFDDDINHEARNNDKLWKVRPLIDRIQQGCRMQSKEQNLSLDEMIIPFTGSCGIKQYCPMKPNPVGLKAFVLANTNGLVVDFDIYQGSTTYPQYENTNFGLGEKAVLSLADGLVPGHVLFFDRYFTTVKLARELSSRGIGSTGTIQKNRIPPDARQVLINDKDLERQGRGSVHTIVTMDEKMALLKWFDNKPVTLLSTKEGKEPMDLCSRWCKRGKQYISVNRPAIVRNYNNNMGGVDLADRMLAVCPNRYRTRKWTQRFLSHMVDLAVVNSWISFKNRELGKGVPLKKVQQLRHFKMDLGETLIEMYSAPEENRTASEEEEDDQEETPIQRKRGKPTTAVPSKKRRTTGADHLPNMVDNQARCRHCHYKLSRIRCTTCDIALCLTKQRNCYLNFHK